MYIHIYTYIYIFNNVRSSLQVLSTFGELSDLKNLEKTRHFWLRGHFGSPRTLRKLDTSELGSLRTSRKLDTSGFEAT